MKVCFVTSTLKFSGAEKIISNLMYEFNKRGHEVSVIMLGRDEPYPEKFDYAKQYPAKTRGNKITRVLNRYKAVRKIVKDNKFDVVLSFNCVFNLDIIMALLFTGTNLIVCERNDPNYDPVQWTKKLRRKIFYPFAKGFIFQTDVIKSYFSKDIQKRSAVIPNFIENTYTECVAENKRRKVIATCARLDDFQKNQSMLIRAFSRFCEGDTEYTLEFYGDGPDMEKYKKLIKELNMEDRIKLLGRTENVNEKLKDVEIFVLPSVFEGMPNALIEAMASGLPCIATDCGGGGSAALINNMENGILIPENDEDALLEAFKIMTSDENLRIKLGKEAFKINEKLEINKIVDLWEEAIKKL